MSDPLLFVLAVLTLLGTPGPTNTLLATSGALAGIRQSLLLLVAELGGYLIAIVLIRLILGPLFHAYPLIGMALKIAVAAYLVWVGIRLWLRGTTLANTTGTVTFMQVFVTTTLNPKALIFALTIFPAEHPQLGWYFAGFALCVASVGCSWILIGRAIGATAGERHATLVPRIASVALVGFAGFIAVSAFG